MHGQYIRNVDRQLIGEDNTFIWLSKGDPKAETDSEIVAAQDRALQTEYYATEILNTETESKGGLCQQLDETVDHIISSCPLLAIDPHVPIPGLKTNYLIPEEYRLSVPQPLSNARLLF